MLLLARCCSPPSRARRQARWPAARPRTAASAPRVASAGENDHSAESAAEQRGVRILRRPPRCRVAWPGGGGPSARGAAPRPHRRELPRTRRGRDAGLQRCGLNDVVDGLVRVPVGPIAVAADSAGRRRRRQHRRGARRARARHAHSASARLRRSAARGRAARASSAHQSRRGASPHLRLTLPAARCDQLRAGRASLTQPSSGATVEPERAAPAGGSGGAAPVAPSTRHG